MMSMKGCDREILLTFADNEAPDLWNVEAMVIL